MKKLILSLAVLCSAFVVNAQQDPMFTKYLFNPLYYNPAVAGSNDALSLTLLHRQQWLGIEGAPMTQSFTAHTPLRNEKVSLGFSGYLDQIGITRQIGLYGSFAYRFPITKKLKLSLGVQGGVLNWRSDYNDPSFNPSRVGDPNFVGQPSTWLPNFGAGMYLNSKKFFFGFSVPHLLNGDLRNYGNTVIGQAPAQQARHYFMTTGVALPLNRTESIVFRPVILWKNVGMFMEKQSVTEKTIAAPNELDIDLSLIFNKRFWVGAAYRTAVEGNSSNDSVDAWFSILMNSGLRIGAAYDYHLTALQGPGKATYELMLGYDFYRVQSKINTPRYF